jgi:hypothetical protein
MQKVRLEFQDAIHRARSVDEVGELLRRFMAMLPQHETAAIHPSLLAISTFSERGLAKKAALARQTAGVASSAELILASAALRVGVLHSSGRAHRPGLLQRLLGR